MTEPDKPEQSPSPPPPPPQQYGYGAYPGYPPQQQPYGYGPYPGYPPQPYGGYPAPPPSPKNGLGIASLVVAIIGLLTLFGGIVLGIVAIVLGFLGRARVKRGEADNGGVAVAGIVLGFLGIIVSIAAIIVVVRFVSDVGAGDYLDCLREAGNDSAAQQQCEQSFTQNIEDQFSVTLTPTR
jgi:hypothetical protein